jgi:hypothetical protein
MKRECLLSGSYANEPMKFNGVEIFFCPLVSETLRTLQTPFFTKAQYDILTQHTGICEAIYIMYMLATEKRDEIKAHKKRSEKERMEVLSDFYLDNEDQVELVKPQIIERMEQALASNIESEGEGKSQ